MEKIKIIENARGQCYQTLSLCFISPGRTLRVIVDRLVEQAGIRESKAYDHADGMRCCLAKESHHELMQDYTKLFLGPFSIPAPPYGSIYLENERSIMGESSMDVLQTYSGAGLKLSHSFRDAPDHIAVELEFMHFLVIKGVNAFIVGDSGALVHFLDYQKRFMNCHLGLWVGEFTDRVRKSAKTGFYHHLAGATHSFVSEELLELSKW